MKQILCRILVLLVVVAAILGLSSCNIFIEQDVTFYDLVVNDFDREVVYGSELDFSGLEIEATTGDDVKYIPVNSSMIVSGDTKTVGAHELEIEYGGFSWTLAYEVFYKVEHIVDGLVYDSQLVSSRDEILYVKDPVKNGSIFLGWSTDMPETLTGNVRREAVFVDNITLPKLSATYGDTLGDITLPTVSGGKWHWQDSAETSVGNAGTNVFKLVYVFDDTTKGELTFDVDVEVAKKHVDIKVLDEVFEYNGKVNTVRYELSEAVPAEDVICFGDIAGTEIGEYSYTIRIFNDNYEGQYSGTFEIEPIDITIAILLLDPSDGVYKSEVIIDYGNSFPEYKIVITDKNGNDYKLDAELSVSKPVLLKAGEHPVTTSFDDEHYDPKIIGATLKVNTVDLDPGVPGLIGAENVVFGDKLSEILFEEHQLGYWEWDLSHGDTVGNAGKNTFTAVFVPKDSSYNEYRYDVELTVNRKQLTFDITSSRTFVFDGKEYGLTYNVIDPNSREVVSGLKVLGNQKFVNAGTHSVTLEFEDKNYQAIENTFTFTISQATIEKDFSFIVDDVWFQGITLSDIPLPEGYKWNNPGIQIGEPGGYSYDATFYPEDQNYATVSGSLAIILDKATPSLTTDKKAYDSLIYNTSEHKLSGVITHNSNSDMRNNIEYYISGTDEQITGLTNAGTYNIDVVVPESNKYKSAKVSVVVVVNKANPSIDRPVIDGWTFGGEADEPTSGSKQVEIAGFHYYTEECGQYTKLDGVPTNAGTYYVTAYSLATDNYNAAESDYRQFVIEKFVVTRPTLAHDVYTGGTLSATVPASSLYKVSENGNPARMNAGTYEVTLELLDSDNYIWNNGDKLTTKVSYVIDKATINLSAITGSNSFKYDDAFDFLSEKTYTTEHVANFGEVVYLYATINNPTVFTEVVPKNIGTYLVKAVVYADEANNWKTVETAPFRFEITKRPIPVPELSETTSVFNGDVFKPTAPENEEIYTIEYENENSINKGEYKVTFTIIDQNYKWADGANGERTYTITAATPKIYDVVSGGWTFGTPITHSASAKVTADGHEDYLINVENAVRVVYYNISNKNVPINKPSNAGTYYVRFVVSADNNNGNWVSTSSDYIEFVIEQFALDVPELDGTGVYTFTGSDIPLTVKENNAHKAHYTVSGNVERNVGSYTAVYSLENSNYKWNDETTADKTIDYKIQQAGSSVTGLAITPWTFNDAANAPVYTAKTSTGYTIPVGQISISFRKADSDSWTTISPSEWATKGPHYAGDYYVKVSVASDENNNWATSESTEFKLNIAKDDYDMSGVSWNYTSPFTFNDGDHTVSVTGTLPSGVSVKEYTGNVEENAGTYTANVKFSYDSDNYNEPTLASLEWTINPQIVNKPEADTTEFVYNTTEQKYVLATHSGYTISGNLQTNAGTHTVTVTLNNEEIVNYKWNDGTYTAKTYDFVISPKALETTFVTLANTLEYNETAQTQTVLVKFGKEVLELDEDYFVTGNVQTDAGENYKLTVTAKAGSNYTGSVDIPYTVARKPIPKPSAATGLAFNNGTLDSGIYTIEGQWTAVDTAEAATVNDVTPAGDYKVTVTLNSNYKWNDGSITPLELPYKIDKATIKLTNLTAQYPEGASSWTFNDTIAYKATSDKTFVESEIKYLYSKTLNGTYTEDFTFDKATTYYVMAQVDAGDNWYVASTAPVQFKINQMPVPVPSVNTIPVYAQGTTYELIDILTNFDSSIMSFEEGSVTSSDVAGGFNAKVVLDANYVWESTFDGKISWSVSKAPASITIENAIFNKDYSVGGYSIYDIVSGITGNHSEVDPDYSIKTFGDANTYTVTVTLAESANYFSAESKDITIIINPIDTPDVISGLVATYGDLLSSVKLDAYNEYGIWEWIETSGTPVGTVGERTFKAKFTPHTNKSGTTNYKAIDEKALTVTVGQKEIFVPYVTAGQTFTYKLHDADKSITPNLTVPTLVEGDEAVDVYRIEGLTNYTATTHTVIVTLINGNYKWNDGAEGTTRTFTYTIDPYKITIPKVIDKIYADGASIDSGLGNGVSGEYTVESDPTGTTAGTTLTVVLKLEDYSNTVWHNLHDVTNAEVYGDNNEYVKITYSIVSAPNSWVEGKEPTISASMTYGTATVTRPEVLHGNVKMEYKLKSATQWIEIPEGENLPADLSVGKYHIRFTSTDESASKLQEALDFTIVAAPATINVTNGLGTGGIYLTEGYDLSKITAKANANVGGAEIDVAIYLNGEKVESLGTVYAVDTYEVVFKLANDNYSAAEQSVTVEITKAPLNIPVIGDLDYKEVTENQKPVVELDFDESLVEITNNGGINVVDGGYTVIIKITADAYTKYEWNTENKPANAEIVDDTVTITYMIKKVTNSFTYADGYNADKPLYVENWTYDNEANLPVGITGSAFGEVKYQYYKLNTKTNEYEPVDLKDVKYAGDYKVVAYVEANGNNYDRIESLPAYFEITVREITPPTFSLPEGLDKFVFEEDTVHNPDVTESADSKYYSYTFGNEGNDDAGTYSVIVSINEEHVGSVVWAENAITDFPYTVDKAPVPIPDLTNSIVYTGSAINGTYAPNNLYSEVVAERVSATDAGEVGSLTFELNDPNNFRWENDLTVENGLTGTEVTTTKTFTVTPAPVDAPTINGTYVYGESKVDGEAVANSHEIKFNNYNENYMSNDAVVQTQAGSYKVTIKLTDRNHVWSEGTIVNDDGNVELTWTIATDTTNKVNIYLGGDLAAQNKVWTYGDQISYSASHKYGTLDVTYINNETGKEAVFVNGTLPVGSYTVSATLTVVGHTNYNGGSASVTFTVEAATAKFDTIDKSIWNNKQFGSVKSEAPSPEVFLENNTSFVVEDASIKVYYKLQTEVAVAAFSVEEDPWAGWTLWTAENYPSAVGKYYIAVVVETDEESNYNTESEYSETFEIEILKANTSIDGVGDSMESTYGSYTGPKTKEELLSGVSVKRGDGTVVVTPSIEIDFVPYVTGTAWDGEAIGSVAGTYTITYSYAGDDSHNAAKNDVRIITIKKATSTISGVTNGDVINVEAYDGLNHLPNVTINGNTATPAIVYTAPVGYEGTIPTNGVTAGTYVLTYSFAGDNNYEPMTNDVVVTLNIAQVKADTTVISSDPYTATYGDSASEIVNLPTDVTGGVWKLYNSNKTTLATTVGNATNEGEYNIFYARFESNNVNYASTDYVEVKISVAKADSSIEVPTIENSEFNFVYTYANTDYLSAIKDAIKITTDGIVTWGGATVVNNAGTYTVTISISEGANYNATSKDIKINVTPATFTDVSLSGGDVPYNGSAQQHDVTVYGVDNGVLYEWNEATQTRNYTVSYSTTSGNYEDVGTITVTVTGVGNYAGATWTGNYEITPKVIGDGNVSLSGGDVPYNGYAQQHGVTVIVGEELSKWDEEKQTGDYKVSYRTTSTSGNYKDVGTITVTVEGQGNYSGYVTKTYEILTKYVTAPAWESNTKLSYVFGTEFTAPKPTGSVDKDYYTVSTPSGTDVGTYTYIVTLKSEHGDNIAWKTGTTVNASNQVELSYTITEAPVIAPVIGNFTYNGDNQAADIRDFTGENGKYKDVVVSIENAGGTNAGTYSVVIKIDGNHKWVDKDDKDLTSGGNYTLSADGKTLTITYVIDPAEITATLEVPTNSYIEAYYKASPYVSSDIMTLVGNVKTSGTIYGNDTISYKVVYYSSGDDIGETVKNANAANQKYELKLASANSNYKVTNNVSIDVVIKKATPKLGSTFTGPFYENLIKQITENGDVYLTDTNTKVLIRFISTDDNGNVITDANGNEIVVIGTFEYSIDDYSGKTGASIGTTLSYTFTPEDSNYISITGDDGKKADITLKTVATIGLNGTAFGTIEKAIANASEGDTVWVLPDTTGKVVIKGNEFDEELKKNVLTIPSKVTLLIPYGYIDSTEGRNKAHKDKAIMPFLNYDYEIDQSKYVATKQPGAPNDKYNPGSQEEDDISSLDERMSIVTLAENVVIKLSGTLEISGELSGGYGGYKYAGQTAGNYAEFKMETGSHIIVQSGGVIETFGFITESSDKNGSSITVQDGGTIYQPFVLYDYAGGGALLDIKENAMEKYHVSPFQEFTIMNIHSFITYEYGASLYVIANMYTPTYYQQNGAVFQMLGSDDEAFIQMTNSTYSSITAKYNKTTMKIDLDLYGGAKTNVLTLKVKAGPIEYPMDTNTVFFPIPWSLDISLNQAKEQTALAEYTVGQRMQLLWGSKLVVEKGARLSLTGSSKTDALGTLYIHHADNYASLGTQYGMGTYANPFGYKTSAECIVNGELVVNYIGGMVSSAAKDAKITVNAAASATVYKYNGGTSLTPFTSALKLVNKDKPDISINNPLTSTYDGSKWIVDSIKINYNSAGSVVGSTTAAGGNNCYTAADAILQSYERAGYTFLGWYLDPNFKTLVPDDYLAGTFNNPGTDVVNFYAKWAINEVYIHYDSNGGTINGSSEYKDTYTFEKNGNSGVYNGTFTAPTPVRDGYVFLGWYTDEGYGTAASYSGSRPYGSSDVTVYAKWIRSTVTVNYNSNGGTNVGSTTLTYNPNTGKYEGTLSTTVPTKDYYMFTNWDLNGANYNSGAVLAYTNTAAVDYVNPAAISITVTAEWRAISYTINYNYKDGNGNTVTVSAVASQNFTIGESITFPVPTHDTLSFAGWYKTYSGTSFSDAFSVTTWTAEDLIAEMGLSKTDESNTKCNIYASFESVVFIIHYENKTKGENGYADLVIADGDTSYNVLPEDAKKNPTQIQSATLHSITSELHKTDSGKRYYFSHFEYNGVAITDLSAIIADATNSNVSKTYTITAVWVQKAIVSILVSGTNSDTNHGMTHVSSSNNKTVYVPINTVYEYTLEDVTANNNKTNMQYYSTGWVYSGCSSATNGINVTSMTASVTVTWKNKYVVTINYNGLYGSDGKTLTNETRYICPGTSLDLSEFSEKAKGGDSTNTISKYFGNSWTNGTNINGSWTVTPTGDITVTASAPSKTQVKTSKNGNDGFDNGTLDSYVARLYVNDTNWGDNKTYWYIPNTTLSIRVANLVSGWKITVNDTEITSNKTISYTVGTSAVTIQAEEVSEGSGGSSGGGCVTGETLITLADGSQEMIKNLEGNEMILVWNHYTGKVDIAPILVLYNNNGNKEIIDVLTLRFSDGTYVEVVGEHVFFNKTLNKYVGINNNNVEEFVGHSFAKLSADNVSIMDVTLIDYSIETRCVDVYDINSNYHHVAFVNGMLSCSAGSDISLNSYEFENENLIYSEDLMQADIEKYGFYTYEDFEGLISKEIFDAFHFYRFKICVGKGYITWDEIVELCNTWNNSGAETTP